MAPIHDDINLKRKWRLERLKARMAPPKFWSVSHHHKTGFQKIDKIDETRLEPSNL
jgi:hypothetical protein